MLEIIGTPKIITTIVIKLGHAVMVPKDSDGIAKSVDPDQTAPLGAV